mmetsp:Transcript_16540/g.32876  ORF Transcript_16540/g.32876 Transcript_16540/m.32876 type:complete len:245 (+) Transcript_16540:59-793(+)
MVNKFHDDSLLSNAKKLEQRDRSWESVVEIMHDLTSLYGSEGADQEDDIATLRHIGRELSEGLPSASESSLRRSKAVVERVEEATVGRIRCERAELAARRRDALSSTAAAERELAEGTRALIELTGLRDASADAAAAYRTAAEEAWDGTGTIDEEVAARIAEVPRVRSTLSMYASVTGIKWEFEEDEGGGGGNTTTESRKKNQMLQGIVTIPFKQEAHRFCIDPVKSSSYEISNKLWGLMEGGG